MMLVKKVVDKEFSMQCIGLLILMVGIGICIAVAIGMYVLLISTLLFHATIQSPDSYF